MNRVTFPLEHQMQGQDVGDLQDALQLLVDRSMLLADDERLRRELAEALQNEQAQQTFGDATMKLVFRYQEEQYLQASGVVDEQTARALNELLERLGAFGKPKIYRVEGRVVSRVTPALNGLRVLIVDKIVGNDILLVETSTDLQGKYNTSFSENDFKRQGKDKPDLQVRIFSGEHFLAASEVRYEAKPRESIHVFLGDKESKDLGSEYETLTATISSFYKGKLADLQETNERQDISYLANKSGWDARAVALAALADQFSASTGAEGLEDYIEPAFFYALFRSGIPATQEVIYRTDPESVEKIWKKGLEQGIIPNALREKLPSRMKQFTRIASRQLLEGSTQLGLSSFKDILKLSLQDKNHQEQVAALHVQYGRDLSKFWKKVQDVLGEDRTKRLKLNGHLAHLTLNNVPLIQKLHAFAGGKGFEKSVELVSQGFYRAARWREAIGGEPVPPEIQGEDEAEKQTHYSELLAAKLRLSFPTAVVAQMVHEEETPVNSSALRADVHAFLVEHEDKFQIGMQPVAQYVERNNIEVVPEVVQEVTRIQRVYQITPDDESMNFLLEKNVDSAASVAGYDCDDFVRVFKDDVGGEQNARLIHAKATQVHAAVLNIALSFLTSKSAPGIGVHSPAHIINPEPANVDDILEYGKMENLFSEMDYCTCDHCRSILSPAAYMVDLLQFLDRTVQEIPRDFSNPQEVLLSRRPDIQHLPLSCENTNTPIPYIDLVNETLEYYITNDLSLNDFKGHNTDGTVKPEELLASPQFVSDTAYGVLAEENFPFPLPFDQRLESLRRYFRRFQTPLADVMEVLRENDNLERESEDKYGWRDIWMERVGLSRAEYRLLTKCWDSDEAADVTLTVKILYGFNTATPIEDVLEVLVNAKSFCRRVGISYKELASILRTRFVNPNVGLIPKLERLGVSFSTLKDLKEHTITDPEFDERLAHGIHAKPFGGDNNVTPSASACEAIRSWVMKESNYDKIMSLIVLINTDDSGDVCSFDDVQLRYSIPDIDKNSLRPFEFIRLIRFIRLWKKLGWSIEQTDQVISALYPTEMDPEDSSDEVNLKRLDAGFLTLLPTLGVMLHVMERLNLSINKDLSSMLACMAPIETYGTNSLYRKLFLSPTPLDDAFTEDGYGNYLTESATLSGHAASLKAAFSLATEEFNEITDELDYGDETSLVLDNISEIFRRGWLARTLKLSVREFLFLTRLTGYDPFGIPDSVDPSIRRLIDLIEHLHTIGVKPVQLLYLFWNQDLAGTSAPADTEITDFARSLRSSLQAIEDEFSLTDDSDGSIARVRMALVYGTDISDFFFSLLDGSFVTEVPYSHGKAMLEQDIMDTASGNIAYDHFKKRLSFKGILNDETAEALKVTPGITPDFQTAVDRLHEENHKIIDPFFYRSPELLSLHDEYLVSEEPLGKRRIAMLEKFLPELKRRHKHQQILQLISGAAGVELGMASNLLENKAVMHAARDNSLPAIEDFIDLESSGLSVQYFYGETAEGLPDLIKEADGSLEYSNTESGKKQLPVHAGTPGSRISGIWSGFLEVPENGFYNIRIETDASAIVTLLINGSIVRLATDTDSSWSNSEAIELVAGILHEFSFKVENVRDKLAVRWQPKLEQDGIAGKGWEIIPARYLYSSVFIENLRRVYVAFLKMVELASLLKLTFAELVHFAVASDLQIDGSGWMNHLTSEGSSGTVSDKSILKVVVSLLDFSKIKSEISSGDERLLEVLRNPEASTEVHGSLLFVLTRWDKPSVEALLEHFGKSYSDLSSITTFHRIYLAYNWMKKLGVPAETLINATINHPKPKAVHDIHAALRARYDEKSWFEVLRPISDEMRSLQRNALVTHILHMMRSNPGSAHIDTPEKLFEYFLMDVQMDPCMLTSRVRHALSSIKLFVERCLMNLETSVSPSSINAGKWEWMKCYRGWEANRKYFIWPENWLEPELRDDQSPFFKEALSELLQGDITEEAAVKGLVSYLKKLEEVAKLEVCSFHYEPNEIGRANDVVHAIARTSGAKRMYFYRRRENGSWIPWEKVNLDIEDNPVLPVVWNNRLFLFWIKLVQEAQQIESPKLESETLLAGMEVQDMFPADKPMVNVKSLLSWSEYIDGQWQTARTSDPAEPITIQENVPLDDISSFRSKLKLAVEIGSESGGSEKSLHIIVSYDDSQKFSFFLYNPSGIPEQRGERFDPVQETDTSSNTLDISYPSARGHTLLRNNIDARSTNLQHSFVGNPWDAPFFYEDARHVFCINTEGRPVNLAAEENDVYMFDITSSPSSEIPSLINKYAEQIHGDGMNFAIKGFGVIGSPSFRNFVSEDAYIGTVIGTPGTVIYGDMNIGPSGNSRT